MPPKPLPNRMRRESRSNLTDEMAVNLLIGGRLQSRDMEILEFVWQAGLASAGQIQRAFFHSVKNPVQGRNATNRRLRWLYKEYCLNRITPKYRSEAVYFADIQGARLIRMKKNKASLRDIHWSAGGNGKHIFQLKHSLGVTETAIQLIEAGRAHNFSLKWRGEAHLQLSTAEGHHFIPDALILLTRAKHRRMSLFLEWDEATETIRQISEKIRRYNHYARREQIWRTDFARFFPAIIPPKRFIPLVFITTGGKKRLQNMMAAVNAIREKTFDKRLPFPVLMSNREIIAKNGIWGDAFFTPDAAINGDFEWQPARTMTTILASQKGD